MTTTDAAKDIRTALKKQGWTSRQVSVRSEYFSMGSSIDITIKDPAISIRDVEEIATPHERVHRCQITGDILSGGNRYLHVRYAEDAITARAAQYVAAVAKAKTALDASGEGHLIPIEGTPYLLGLTQYGRLSLWGEWFLCETYDVLAMCRELACRL